MTWAMKSCFITLVLLFLWRVENGVETCKCMIINPQTVLCSSDVVIRAKVIGKQEVESNDNPGNAITYELDVTEVYKGLNEEIDALYTSSPCTAYLQTNGEDYLITGRLEADGTLHTSMCNYIKLWDDLSADQLNLLQDYHKSCS